MESLKENKLLYRSLVLSAILCLVLAAEVVPDLNEIFELTSIPDDDVSGFVRFLCILRQICANLRELVFFVLQTRMSILGLLAASWLGCWASERVAARLFGPRAAKKAKTA